MDASIEIIGPDEAKTLLAINTRNRHVSPRIVASLARDMTDGKWQMNGESIKVSASGKLLDGQHRLLAVIESGEAIETLIVRGLDESSQDTVDIGHHRSFADILSLNGEPNAHNLAASARTGWYMDTFNRIRVAHTIATTAELMTWLESNGQIREWLPVGRTVGFSPVRYVPSLATALGYLMARQNLLQSEDFWDGLAHGGERPGSPINTLRETLLRDLTGARRMSLVDRAAITIKMWNAYRDGRDDVKVAFYRGSGPRAETFPVIK
jgi:hypothetical protein